MKPLRIIAALSLSLLLYSAAGATTFQGRVTGISDGDTIKIVANREQIKIRLYGIDTPEKKQAFGQAATRKIKSILTSSVTVEKKDTDRYGRTVGIVYTSTGENVNEEMVRSGFAWVYRKYCRSFFCSDWLDLEAQARRSQVGIWQEKAIPPWEWRKHQRQK